MDGLYFQLNIGNRFDSKKECYLWKKVYRRVDKARFTLEMRSRGENRSRAMACS
jgi:hypothetical protein